MGEPECVQNVTPSGAFRTQSGRMSDERLAELLRWSHTLRGNQQVLVRELHDALIAERADLATESKVSAWLAVQCEWFSDNGDVHPITPLPRPFTRLEWENYARATVKGNG